jgi:hypothetical protein
MQGRSRRKILREIRKWKKTKKQEDPKVGITTQRLEYNSQPTTMTMMTMLRACSRTNANRIFSRLNNASGNRTGPASGIRAGEQLMRRHQSSTGAGPADDGEEDGPAPLFIWLGDDSTAATSSTSSIALPKLLLPVIAPSEPTVTTPEDILRSVNQHYEAESQFVGGMGESDPGVWFAITSACGTYKDTLEFYQIVGESIALVKQERHGVPFNLYTTGLLRDGLQMPPLTELGLDCLQVSLFAGSPMEYKKATGLDDPAFGQVCGFIADAVEQGVPVEVGILKAYASGGARDLALSLGARDVHVYDQ